MSRKLTIAGIAVASALVLSACAGAAGGDPGEAPEGEPVDSYPEDSITYLVPFPAGSAPDAGARVIAQQLEEILEVNVTVENLEGGSATIGLMELASAEPDGYTIGTGTIGISVYSRILDTPFEGLSVLTPIAQTNEIANVLFARPDRGWDSIEDFIEEAKDNPGQLQVGLPAPGSIQDIQLALLEESAGISVEKVYYDAGQQILPTVNGTLDAAIAQPGPVVQFVDKGDLAWVGVFGNELPGELDAELFGDAGYDTSQIVGYEGVFGPAGLPENVVQRLSEAVGEATESDAYQEFIAKSFGVVAYRDAEAFAESTQAQDEQAEQIIETLGLTG